MIDEAVNADIGECVPADTDDVVTESSSREKKALELESFKASSAVLFSPGPIIHIFKEITGTNGNT